jgi:riboflavin synthase
MFTGIIEEIGTIKSIRQSGKSFHLTVEGNNVLQDMKIDDSVSISGVCQTVIAINGKTFEVEAVEETLRKTNLPNLRAGIKVNLERAMALGGRLGGHLVQGHVDCTGKVLSIESETTGRLAKISYPNEFAKLLVNTGSICVDGVSLTIARLENTSFTVSIIPHTWSKTTLGMLKPGLTVNLEFDIIGKYIERMLVSGKLEFSERKESILNQYIDQPD